MKSYSRDELQRIANAVRNVWAGCYDGGMLPGMSRQINTTGQMAYEALKGDAIEVVGGGIFSGLPLIAIIAMAQSGHEEAFRIQDGYDAFDMKPGFLRSPKARTSKEGKKYFIMSFRHATPGTTGRLGKTMSPSVHKEAKSGGKFEDQMGRKEDPSDFGLVNSRGYEWQNGPYAGMSNKQYEQGATTQSQYRTFRVISKNSDPNSWWHPGVSPNDVVGSVVNYVEPYVKEGLMRAAKSEVADKIKQIFSVPLSVE